MKKVKATRKFDPNKRCPAFEEEVAKEIVEARSGLATDGGPFVTDLAGICRRAGVTVNVLKYYPNVFVKESALSKAIGRTAYRVNLTPGIGEAAVRRRNAPEPAVQAVPSPPATPAATQRPVDAEERRRAFLDKIERADGGPAPLPPVFGPEVRKSRDTDVRFVADNIDRIMRGFRKLAEAER